jgi:Protein of unknown function (DUF3551)
MRLALIPLAIGALLATATAQAQTYAPGYPVCLHVYGRASYYDCTYTSLAQCNMSASGRAAQCVVSPYYANAGVADPPARYRRHRHVY